MSTPRAKVIGPDSGPEPPYPLKMRGKVVKGFGRGSKELGIPTANLPVDGVDWISGVESGVYFGWAGIELPPSHPDLSSSSSSPSTSSPPTPSNPDSRWRLYPMVMSIGFNPFYKNTIRSAEVHVMHSFTQDFYGSEMAIRIEGFIRKELDYTSLEALVEDIREDIEVARRSLGREAWKEGLGDGFLVGGE